MKIVIVGAGMAGLACAERLVAQGCTVVLFDKGRAAGGRMASRRVATALGEASFDHGAQYFTVRDAGFRARVQLWADAGLAAPWPAAGPDAWVGTPAMNAPVRQMAAACDVRWNTTVTGIARDAGGWRVAGEGLMEMADAVVVAIPAEQAGPMVQPHDPAIARRAAGAVSQPCWTVMAAFSDRVAAANILREQGVIGWAARNSAKPGRTGPEAWVIQAAPAWSAAHLEQSPDSVVGPLLSAFATATAAGAALPPVLSATAHRWRYARCGTAAPGDDWNPNLRLGVCGDWLAGPRVEAAWCSGDALAARITGGSRTG